MPLSGATLPCLQMMGSLQRAAVPLLKVGIDFPVIHGGKQLIGQGSFGYFGGIFSGSFVNLDGDSE